MTEPSTGFDPDMELLIASVAAQKIVARAARGGTDAVTYEGVRDMIQRELQRARSCSDSPQPPART